MCDHRNVRYATVAGSRRTDICPLRGCEVQTFRQICPRCRCERAVTMTDTSFAAGNWERRYRDGTCTLTRLAHAACLEAYKWFGWRAGPNRRLSLIVVHVRNPGSESWRVELCGSQLDVDRQVATSRLSEFDALARALGRAEDLAIRLLGPVVSDEDDEVLDAFLAAGDHAVDHQAEVSVPF